MKQIKTYIVTLKFVKCPNLYLDDIIPVTFEQCKRCEYFKGFVMDNDAIYCCYGEGESR